MQRRALLSSVRGLAVMALAPLAISACGFKLRGSQDFAFKSVFLGVGAASELSTDIQRALQSSGSNVTVLRLPADRARSDVVLDIVGEQREKVVVGVNASGQVREFQLRVRIEFRLSTVQGKELIATTEILQQRDISFNETAVLGKEAEEAQLYREMQSDVVQQLMRRLAAVRQL